VTFRVAAVSSPLSSWLGSAVIDVSVPQQLAIGGRQLLRQVVKFVISHVFIEAGEHSSCHAFRVGVGERRSVTHAMNEFVDREVVRFGSGIRELRCEFVRQLLTHVLCFADGDASQSVVNTAWDAARAFSALLSDAFSCTAV
jgi:hypothetical protein